MEIKNNYYLSYVVARAVKGTVQGHLQGFLRVFSPEIAILMLSKFS